MNWNLLYHTAALPKLFCIIGIFTAVKVFNICNKALILDNLLTDLCDKNVNTTQLHAGIAMHALRYCHSLHKLCSHRTNKQK